MNRRTLIRTIAASSVVPIGIGTAAGRRPTGQLDIHDVDVLYAVRDRSVVADVSDPSTADLAYLREVAGTDGRVVTADDCCIVECVSRCGDCIDWDEYTCCHYMRDDC